MFTGIIEASGMLAAVTPAAGDAALCIQTGHLDLADVQPGDSIAVNGVCLTVVRLTGDGFVADASCETLSRTTLGQLGVGSRVNLEKALTPTTRLGGHLVSGHVDGVGKVLSLRPDARSTHIEVQAPAALARYIAQKGSITVDGISLTVNEVSGALFALNIVPHTRQVTTIGEWQAGTAVNLEVDILARYLERLLLGDKAADAGAPGMDMAFLAKHGVLQR